jgi:hypothetical protein
MGQAPKNKEIEPMDNTPKSQALTAKERWAIVTYVNRKLGDVQISRHVVDAVLEAEQIPRETLYAYLESLGCSWEEMGEQWQELQDREMDLYG